MITDTNVGHQYPDEALLLPKQDKQYSAFNQQNHKSCNLASKLQDKDRLKYILNVRLWGSRAN